MSTDPVPSDRAAFDRIDHGQAVLLIGPQEDEAHVPVELLPANVEPGDWLVIRTGPLGIEIAGVDAALTEQRRANVSQRMRSLRQQRRGGRFPPS